MDPVDPLDSRDLQALPDFRLEFSDLHWLEGQPEEIDLCAHGAALVMIGTQMLVTPEAGNDWTLSAAAFHLLRTLNQDHGDEHRVGDHLIPCCGTAMWLPDDGELHIIECPNGVDWTVGHADGQVILTAADGEYVILSSTRWREAVLRVADQVHGFYRESLPKHMPDDEADRRGYQFFWQEWEWLRSGS